jgi:hypothetical protein
MTRVQRGDIQKAALIAGRSERTIRRWAKKGVDIHDEIKLTAFVIYSEKRSFGRYGKASRLMGKKGGSKTSDSKRQSSKRNGGRGGRPREGMDLLRGATQNKHTLDLRGATDTDLKAVWSTLVDIEGSLGFWIGDALIEIERRGGEESLKYAINQTGDPKLFRNYLKVSRNFKGSIPAVQQHNIHS